MKSWQRRFIPSRPPLVMIILPASASTPLGARSSLTTMSRRSGRPMTLPYWRASTPLPSLVITSFVISRTMSMGRASLAGAPPPKEMMPGSFMAPKRPLMMAADFSMVFILWAKTVMMLPLFSGRLATRSLPALYHFGGKGTASSRANVIAEHPRKGGSRPCCHSEDEARRSIDRILS